MLKIIFPVISMLFLPFLSNLFFHQVWMTYLILSFMTLFFIPMNFLMVPMMTIFSMDLMSFLLVLLSLWITSLMMLASYTIYSQNKAPKMFSLTISVLLLTLILTFSTNNFMMFYTMFEASLVPTLLLIIGWGYQPERLSAGFYLMMYTITASLPLLLGLTFIFKNSFHLSMLMFNFKFFVPLKSNLAFLMWATMITAFLVKMPLYLVHLWLPKAHVEAPVAGSMILAGILLKLGGFGIIRISSPFQMFMSNLTPLIMSIALFGAFITGFICIRQHDLKSIIAYSSVGHMGLLTAGMTSCSSWGWYGSLALMIAHGLCSSCMFAMANMFYESTSTRSLFLTKGLMALFPAITFWFFMASAANMAAPPTMNLISEILLLTSILSSSFSSWFLIGFASFLAAAYSLFLYTSTQHGPVPNFINPMKMFTQRNYSICLMHLAPLFVLSFKAEIFTMWI